MTAEASSPGRAGGRFGLRFRARFRPVLQVQSARSVGPSSENAGRLRREHSPDRHHHRAREHRRDLPGRLGTRKRFTGALAAPFIAYSEHEVRRIARVAAALASRRRRNLVVTIKDGEFHQSRPGRRYVTAEAEQFGIDPVFLGIDMRPTVSIQDAPALDVILTPNLLATFSLMWARSCSARADVVVRNFNSAGPPFTRPTTGQPTTSRRPEPPIRSGRSCHSRRCFARASDGPAKPRRSCVGCDWCLVAELALPI